MTPDIVNKKKQGSNTNPASYFFALDISLVRDLIMNGHAPTVEVSKLGRKCILMQEVKKTVKGGNFYIGQAEKAHFMRVSGRGVNNLCAKEQGGKFLRSEFISDLE